MHHHLLLFCLAFAWMIVPQPDRFVFSQDTSRDDKQADAIANRFLSILEKNPQRGTALDKVFNHHLQRGSLDRFIGELDHKTKTNANDDVAWMLLGLLESQRRFDHKAIAAFEAAEKLRASDPLHAERRFAITDGNRESAEKTMKPMVRAVLELVERLRAKGFKAADRYECLLPLFLQGESNAFLFAEQSLLLEEQPVFLASRLLESAVESGRSSELRNRLEQCDSTENKVTLLVFRTQLAMLEKDMSEAKKLLAQYVELLHEETPFSDLEIACHAAIPAFEIDELREAALPILEAYVERVKTRKYYPGSDLQFFRLVQEMNKFVESQKR